MTHLCVAWLYPRRPVGHDSLWVILCDMTYSRVTWRIHIWHNSSICGMTLSAATGGTWRGWCCAPFTFTVVCSSSFVTGWRRCIGCLKLQVIFRKRATNYRALLQKMTCEDKPSYDSTPPCTQKTDAWYVCSSYIHVGVLCRIPIGIYIDVGVLWSSIYTLQDSYRDTFHTYVWKESEVIMLVYCSGFLMHSMHVLHVVPLITHVGPPVTHCVAVCCSVLL